MSGLSDYEYDLSAPVFDLLGASTIADLASDQYLHVAVVCYDESTGNVINPTGSSVSVAILTLPEEPEATINFVSASWLTETTSTSTTYYIRIEIGPEGAIVPANAGDYAIYVTIGSFQGRAGVVTFI